MLPSSGLGELKLLLPVLKTLSRQARWIAWVNPPFIPYAPALKAAGVDIDKILLIHPKNHKDALWALERATQSGTCSAAPPNASAICCTREAPALGQSTSHRSKLP